MLHAPSTNRCGFVVVTGKVIAIDLSVDVLEKREVSVRPVRNRQVVKLIYDAR